MSPFPLEYLRHILMKPNYADFRTSLALSFADIAATLASNTVDFKDSETHFS